MNSNQYRRAEVFLFYSVQIMPNFLLHKLSDKIRSNLCYLPSILHRLNYTGWLVSEAHSVLVLVR